MYLTIFMIFLLVPMRVLAEDILPIKIHEAVPYCKGSTETLLLDVVEPDTRLEKRMAVLFVHGGGWQGGSRKDYRPLMLSLAQKGIVSFSVDYRLSQTAKFPAQIEDVKCAVRWMRTYAAEYHINAEHIVAIGGSAGAHLVALLGTTMNHKEFEGTGGYPTQRSDVAAMVLHGGGYDLSSAFLGNKINPNSRNNVLALLGAEPTDDPKKYAYASPINFVSPYSAPALLIHGENDSIVPKLQSQLMHDALRAAGAQSELLIVKKGGHQDFGAEPEATHVSKILLDFLQKNLAP